ncbi:hypothetical protein AAKU67_000388 [Oxalobacteraceae bacterium GrIS 2.11]
MFGQCTAMKKSKVQLENAYVDNQFCLDNHK